MGLKRKTGLAMPTLIIAANIPDIDAFAVFLGGNQHLSLRRGLTHGPIAMLILPLLLWGAILWFDSWQGGRGTRPESRLPLHKGWLLALAYIACISHPMLDWLNSYGVRLLSPFSDQWYYGDTLFIIDIWVWITLGLGLVISLRRGRSGSNNWQRPAIIAMLATVLYINMNMLISYYAKEAIRTSLDKMALSNNVDRIVANPVPLAFWRREMLHGQSDDYFQSEFSLFGSRQSLNNMIRLKSGEDLVRNYPDIGKLRARSMELHAFLVWSRLPYLVRKTEGGKRYFIFRDARFSNPLLGDRFSVKLEIRDGEDDWVA